MPENRKMIIEQTPSGEFVISVNFETGAERHEMRIVEVSATMYRLGNWVECAFRGAEHVTPLMTGTGDVVRKSSYRPPTEDDNPF